MWPSCQRKPWNDASPVVSETPTTWRTSLRPVAYIPPKCPSPPRLPRSVGLPSCQSTACSATRLVSVIVLKGPQLPVPPAASPFSFTASATPSGSSATVGRACTTGWDHGKSLNHTTGLNSYTWADDGGPGQVESAVVFSDEPAATPNLLICHACPLLPLAPALSLSNGSALIAAS